MPATTITPDTTAATPNAAPAKLASKVPAAENTLRILKLLASRRGRMAASNIATALGLPRSSVYHLLGVMEANGFVLHLHEEQRYGLGISAFELSSAYSRQEPLSRLGRPLLASLVDAIGDAHAAVAFMHPQRQEQNHGSTECQPVDDHVAPDVGSRFFKKTWPRSRSSSRRATSA